MPRLQPGVSQKMLTQTLRSLERDGLVTRAATPTVPITVSYELTDLGLSLHQMMHGLKAWAEMHMDDWLANREAHYTRTAWATKRRHHIRKGKHERAPGWHPRLAPHPELLRDVRWIEWPIHQVSAADSRRAVNDTRRPRRRMVVAGL